MSTLLFLNVMALASVAWISVVHVVPSCTASFFRYRVWRTRDELVDEIRHGKFDNAEQPKRLVFLLEAAIETAPDLSTLNVVLVRYATRGAPTPSLAYVELDAVSPREREVLGKHMRDFHDAIVKRLLWGTPSGWIVSSIAFPIAIVVALLNRFRRGKGGGGSVLKDATLHVHDREMDSALALMSKRIRRSRDSLAHYV